MLAHGGVDDIRRRVQPERRGDFSTFSIYHCSNKSSFSPHPSLRNNRRCPKACHSLIHNNYSKTSWEHLRYLERKLNMFRTRRFHRTLLSRQELLLTCRRRSYARVGPRRCKTGRALCMPRYSSRLGPLHTIRKHRLDYGW
jgi:hypothetical protein